MLRLDAHVGFFVRCLYFHHLLFMELVAKFLKLHCFGQGDRKPKKSTDKYGYCCNQSRKDVEGTGFFLFLFSGLHYLLRFLLDILIPAACSFCFYDKPTAFTSQ